MLSVVPLYLHCLFQCPRFSPGAPGGGHPVPVTPWHAYTLPCSVRRAARRPLFPLLRPAPGAAGVLLAGLRREHVCACARADPSVQIGRAHV